MKPVITVLVLAVGCVLLIRFPWCFGIGCIGFLLFCSLLYGWVRYSERRRIAKLSKLGKYCYVSDWPADDSPDGIRLLADQHLISMGAIKTGSRTWYSNNDEGMISQYKLDDKEVELRMRLGYGLAVEGDVELVGALRQYMTECGKTVISS